MTQNKRPTIFFDLEAGGLSGYKSSIYSVSFAQGLHGKAHSFYAAPVPGSSISRWSEQNVWEPIKRRASSFQSERSVLSNFLNVLEANKGGVLAGWNIGYVAEPQSEIYGTGPTGFDIPMLMTRAKKYGLENRFEQAFKGMTIRDVGQEYALKLARGLHKFPSLIDEKLHGQIEGYLKQAAIASSQYPGMSDKGLSRQLGSSGVRMAGWKLSSLHKAIFGSEHAAHISEADIEATQKLAQKLSSLEITPEFATAWNKEALKDTLVNTLIKSSPGPDRYKEALIRADKFGIRDYFESSLLEEVRSRGGNIEQVRKGMGIQEVTRKVGKDLPAARLGASSSGSALSAGAHAVWDFVKRNKKLSIGVAAIGALALFKPLGLFGKDKDRIEGMGHGGEAERMRNLLTDFGSPVNLAKAALRAQKLYQKQWLKSLKQSGISTKGIQFVSDISEEAGAQSLSLLVKNREGKTLGGMARLFGKGEVELTRIEVAKGLPGGLGKSLYEAEPQILKKLGFAGDTLTSPIANPITARWQTMMYGSAPTNSISNIDQFRQRLLSKNISHEEFTDKFAGYYTGRIPGKDDAYNIIEGLQHGGIAERFRKFFGFGSGWTRITSYLGNLITRSEPSLAAQATKKSWSLSVGEMKQMSREQYYQTLAEKGMISPSRAKELAAPRTAPEIYSPVSIEDIKSHFVRYENQIAEAEFNPVLKRQLQEAEEAQTVHHSSTRGLTEAKTNPGVKISKAVDKSEMARNHHEAMVRAATNATSPGRRHTGITGKIVK